ncbi:type II toxin-antitoxin system Phd/YefM family antitoxin [Salinarimonas chemoclinalis]|uniref:type II toxin-antitoxin system Phd/YefM family antitoxin n=1 Tax=Salinarimonas chemoclinalis TaxID=3241599 RepID=UPI003558BB3F
MEVTVHEAKTQLSRLIEAALAGERVVIRRGREPVVELVPVVRKRFEFGLLPEVGPGPDFLEPMSEEELSAWEGGK